MAANREYIKVSFIRVQQPIGDFYIASIDSKDLLSICYADIREIEHEGDFETYLGIQRVLSPGRISDLKQYVGLIDATFPTSIILAINNRQIKNEYEKFQKFDEGIFDDIEEEENEGELDELPLINRKIFVESINGIEKLCILKDDHVAKIIDGQHRIEGLRNYSGERPFQLNVTIFIDMDIEDQAIVFSTINKAQTKVNNSISYDLYDLAKSRSPQKTCHNVAKFLNKKDGSPFYDKIKILGTADDVVNETITQATFVECLINYISKNPVYDRDILKRKQKLKLVNGKELIRLFLRNLFIEKEDAKIAKIVFNYFKAVENRWPDAWIKPQIGLILNKSTGFVVLFKFFGDAYRYLCRKPNSIEIDEAKIGQIFSVEQYEDIFRNINLSSEDFTPVKYVPGHIGRKDLYNKFKLDSQIS